MVLYHEYIYGQLMFSNLQGPGDDTFVSWIIGKSNTFTWKLKIIWVDFCLLLVRDLYGKLLSID